MVQNTVGKLWLQNNPNSKLRDHMPYFIESPSVTSDDYLNINSPEEITLLDQACGSGHILLNAARRIATELAVVRTGEDQPSPSAFRAAIRDVIRHCIYGVDLNPLE